MNKRAWIPTLLLLGMTSCQQEHSPDSIQFADKRLQQVWERAHTSVLSAQSIKQEDLPAVLLVWLALGHKEEAQKEIERLACCIDSLQPSATFSRVAYDVGVFAGDEKWSNQYIAPIIRKCAEYYRSEDSDSDEARYCFERMVLNGLDHLGEYARLLSDSMDCSYPPSQNPADEKSRPPRIEARSAGLGNEAQTALTIIQSLVSDSKGELEVAKNYPWSTDIHFNNIYSSLGVKVNGSIVGKQVDVVMEAWRDTDFTWMGERICLAKGQKVERSFYL